MVTQPTVTPNPIPAPTTDRLLNWHICWRKVPRTRLGAQEHAAWIGPAVHVYRCPLDPGHWHVGRPLADKPRWRRREDALRDYRKDVRSGYLTWLGVRRPIDASMAPRGAEGQL